MLKLKCYVLNKINGQKVINIAVTWHTFQPQDQKVKKTYILKKIYYIFTKQKLFDILGRMLTKHKNFISFYYPG